MGSFAGIGRVVRVALPLALVASGFASAGGLLDDGISALAALCNAGKMLGTESLAFVCSSLKTLEDLKARVDGFTGDIEGLWERTRSGAIATALDNIGSEAGAAQIDAWIKNLDSSLNQGYAELLAQADGVATDARNRAFAKTFTPPADPTSPAGRATQALLANPNLAAKAALSLNQNALTGADAVVVSSTAQQIAKDSLASAGRIGQSQAENITNLTNLTHSGLSDTIRDRASNAVSSRAAIQAGLEAQADLAFQFASGINQLLAVNQDQLLLHARTASQMAIFINQYLAEQQQKQMEWKARLEQQLDALGQRGDQTGQNMKTLSDLFSNMGK